MSKHISQMIILDMEIPKINEVSEKVNLAADQIMMFEKPKPCIKCGAPATHLGGFVPIDPAVTNSPKGRLRTVFYWVCDPCFTDIDALATFADEKILEYFRKQN